MDAIKITIIRGINEDGTGGTVADEAIMGFMTAAELPALSMDALEAVILSSVWYLCTAYPAEFAPVNAGQQVRWTFPNPAFDAEKPETAENSRTVYVDLPPERCVSIVFRRHGEKIVTAQAHQTAQYQASQQAAAAADLLKSATGVIL